MKIVTVLKTGGDFDLEYVEAIAQSAPSCYEFVCLSDDPRVPGYIPLERSYPGWWSKMEIFRPGIIDEDIFYLDLDTVILHDISEELRQLEQINHIVMLSDFYFPERPASGIMYIPEYLRSAVWCSWLKRNPQLIMSQMRGDQDFLNTLYDSYLRFDDVIDKDWICSYKAHIAKTHPKHLTPSDVDVSKSKIICFHGKPRPREVGDIWKTR